MTVEPPRTAEELIALYRLRHPENIGDIAYIKPVCMAVYHGGKSAD